MTQEEIIKLAQEAGFENYAYEAAGIFERFARLVSAAEREKFTNTQEFVTLPREVVEQALEDLEMTAGCVQSLERQAYMRDSIAALRAALEQPQSEQEPVATVNRLGTIYLTQAGCGMQPGTRLYTHPQPKREPLTEDVIERLWYQSRGVSIPFARAIEAAHNIK